MAAHRYEFLTRWRLEATPAEVYALLEDVAGYPWWWPAVWLRVEPAGPADSYHITSKGWLPYVLRWTSITAGKVFPDVPRPAEAAEAGTRRITRWQTQCGRVRCADHVGKDGPHSGPYKSPPYHPGLA